MEPEMDQLEALRGVDSLQVVFHRFSDGVEVVKCVLEFCKEVGDVEQNYSNSIQKLLRSSSYSFHSNILMRWLGSDPYQEIGTVRKSWQKLGTELSTLADLHSQKATAYLEAVRKPLQELLPQLEDTRQELKNRIQTLKADLEVASQRHIRERQKYVQLGDSCQRLKEKADGKARQKLLVVESELRLQEEMYREAHSRLLDAHKQFDEDVKALYKRVEDKEIERVNTLKTSLQHFTKTMSNTAPAYLESFQRIVISVDEINGPDDIKHFVGDHKDLTTPLELPVFERHPYVTGEPVTQFTDTPSGPGAKATATNAAKKLLSRLNFRDNKSTSPESSETSSEAERHAAVSPSVIKSGEESDPVITEESNEDSTKPLSEAAVSNRDSSGDCAAFKESSRPAQGKENMHEGKQSAPKDDSVVSGSAKQNEQSHGGQKRTGASNSLEKPTVKVRPQIVATARSASLGEQQALDSKEKAKREVGRPETSSRSSTSSSTTVGHVSNVIQRMQHQNSQEATTAKRVPKPAAATSRLGPVYPHDSLPGPIKPRPPRRTAPSSRPPRAPRPLLTPDMERDSSPTLATLSLPGLTDCSKEELELLSELQQKTAHNDCYGLLGVDSEVTAEELARARRERTKVLHPDHFVNDPVRQAKAQEQLAKVNQVFQDVLKNEETRRHYDQLCRFRMFYVKILQQKTSALENALSKLISLHKLMKKAQMPLALLDEILLAQKLIRTRIKLLTSTQ